MTEVAITWCRYCGESVPIISVARDQRPYVLTVCMECWKRGDIRWG